MVIIGKEYLDYALAKPLDKNMNQCYNSYKSYFSYSEAHMKRIPGKLAATVKIGERGQFVIPKEMRDMFGIQPGDTIVVFADKKRGIAIPPKSVFNQVMTTVFESGEEDAEEENGEE